MRMRGIILSSVTSVAVRVSYLSTLSHADADTDRQTYMTKLIVAFLNFANFTGRTHCVENLAKANRYSRGSFLLCGGLLILAEDKGRITDSITPHADLPSITFLLRVSHLVAFCSSVRADCHNHCASGNTFY